MKIQDKIDELSRRSLGAPGNQDIADVVDQMSGKYHLGGGDLIFQNLEFTITGAAVQKISAARSIWTRGGWIFTVR